MKTPREILLERHRAAEPKLDAIRQEVVRELNNEATKEQSSFAAFVAWLLCCFKIFWRELILPSRRIWTGLAAVWLLIFAVNFFQRDEVSSLTGKPVCSPAVMMSWQAQQRWMNELLADRAAPPETERPKIFSPKPRTEKNEMMMA
jgi:hypothetical protein